MQRARAYVGLAVFVGLNVAVSALGGWITSTSVGTWYAALAKPAFNPPDWIFAPVWSALYLMLAIAGWRAWRRGGGAARRALTVYAVQLVLNLSWSFVFFGARLIGPALIVIAALLAAIVVNAALFWRLDRLAGALLVPYAAWVSFAAVLNAALWRLN
ncbi:MAG: tryptophan-rich sensory protein [Betaproteobacteria bacterium]|nr:tryptophan-rich sensory protein [Betaproteobacteria bacterium]